MALKLMLNLPRLIRYYNTSTSGAGSGNRTPWVAPGVTKRGSCAALHGGMIYNSYGFIPAADWTHPAKLVASFNTLIPRLGHSLNSWWALRDSNSEPIDYESIALTS